MDMSQLPLALREAAFFESADCYTAMIANKEVMFLPHCSHQLHHPLGLRLPPMKSPHNLPQPYCVGPNSCHTAAQVTLVLMCRHTGGC